MNKIYMMVFSLLVILSFTMSATALEHKSMDRQNGMTAYANWMETTFEGITTNTYISVIESNAGTDVFFETYSYDGEWNYISSKSGYMFTTDDVFSIDKKLNSATLEAVQIDLYQWSCSEFECLKTPYGTATIEANWAGQGDVSKSRYTSTSKDGNSANKFSDSSSWRDATATGSLDGSEFGSSNYGSLGIFKYASMWMQK